MAKPDANFKYHIGQCVTHTPPGGRPRAQRFQVVSQVLQATPSGPQRFYYLRRTEGSAQRPPIANQTLRLLEDHILPLGDES